MSAGGRAEPTGPRGHKRNRLLGGYPPGAGQGSLPRGTPPCARRLHPPVPWEPSSQSPSAQRSRLPAGGGRNRPLLWTSLFRHQPSRSLWSPQRGHGSGPAAPGGVACWWPCSQGCRVRWGSVPRTSRPRSYRRAMPGPPSARGARAPRQPGCGDAPGPLSPMGQLPGALAAAGTSFPSGARGLWPHLAVCPGSPAARVPPACVTVVGLFRAFFHAASPPFSP